MSWCGFSVDSVIIAGIAGAGTSVTQAVKRTPSLGITLKNVEGASVSLSEDKKQGVLMNSKVLSHLLKTEAPSTTCDSRG